MRRLLRNLTRSLVNKAQMKEIVNDPSILVIDVRNDSEILQKGYIHAKNHGHIPMPEFYEALNLKDEDFEGVYNFKKPAKDQEIIVYGTLRNNNINTESQPLLTILKIYPFSN